MTYALKSMPRGRPRKVLSEEEQRKLNNKLKVKNFILRVLAHIEPRKIDWIVETAVARSWAKKYSLDFLDFLELPGFLKNTDSLRPLTGDYGKKYIEKQWNIWVYKNQEIRAAHDLSEKFGPDSQTIKTKPKTLKDFIG